MKKYSADFIKEFYEEFETDLTFKQVREIVEAPFRVLRVNMKEFRATKIRIIYLGVFSIMTTTVKNILKNYKGLKDKEVLINYLKNL